jgi:TRAP-type C4-dicarboxylate transport system permease small subunit
VTPSADAPSRFRRTVDRALAGLLVVLMALLVIDVLWQVASRYLLRAPSSFTEELARFLLIWVGLLGAAYAAGRNMHLAVDLLPAHLSGPGRRLLEGTILGLILLFALAVMGYGGARLVWVTLHLGQTAAALRMPLGYVYIVLPLSGLLMAGYAGAALIVLVRGQRPAPDAG